MSWTELPVEVRWLFVGYITTVMLETPVLLAGLSARHGWWRRLAAGLWLTACTYPTFVLVLWPMMNQPEQRLHFVLLGEGLVFTVEVLLFWAAFGEGPTPWGVADRRDTLVVALANAVSLGLGELLHAVDFFRGWR